MEEGHLRRKKFSIIAGKLFNLEKQHSWVLGRRVTLGKLIKAQTEKF